MLRMSYPNDRRKGARGADEDLSPEFLAVLVVCGGRVRESDRAALDAVNERGYGRRSSDPTPPALAGQVARPGERFDT